MTMDESAYNTAEQFLSRCDPDFAALIIRVGPSRLAAAKGRSPYEALLRAVAHQQLHGKAAEAILGRLIAQFPDHDFPPPDRLLACPDEQLRGCGLSAAKLAAIRDIADKTLDGLVPDAAAAAAMEDAALIERLTSLRGVGRWTVEMLLIFTLGRPDILPVDDFGVREGYRKLKSLVEQPKPKALAELGRAWSPYRSTAAWYLWRASEFKA
jgi:DNA-3-methyladenine glycosylase II